MNPTIKDSVTTLGAFSRRGFIKGASAVAAATTAIPATAATGRVLAYVGAYTPKGKGINIFDLGSDGGLTPLDILTGIDSPSSIAFAPNNKFLYAVNEVSNFQGTTNGSVTAMSVASDGSLKIMNVVDSKGGGPAYISVDSTGKWVFAANYGGGSVSVIPINADGSVGAATDTQLLPRLPAYGVQPAVDAPPGSFSNSGHDAPHAHQAHLDPSGNFLLVTDLASDRVYTYQFDKVAGKLTMVSFVQATSGAGCRHFDFHPNGNWVYVLNEESATINFMSYDAASGGLTISDSIPSVPPGYAGSVYPSEILVTDDGRFVYAANRWCDTIGHFAIGPDGFLTPVGFYWTRGTYPRQFAIEPYGRYLYVCHSSSDNVTAFGVDQGTGRLNFTGKWTPIGNPSRIAFLKL